MQRHCGQYSLDLRKLPGRGTYSQDRSSSIVKVLMDAMILSVMYIWCQLNKETMMSFWFGMQFKAMYMPWVIMLFNWIVSGSYVVPLSLLLTSSSNVLHSFQTVGATVWHCRGSSLLLSRFQVPARLRWTASTENTQLSVSNVRWTRS